MLKVDGDSASCGIAENNSLPKHLKNSKNDKVKIIVRHCLQQTSPLRAGKTTLRNKRVLTQNDNRASADISETDESDNDEYDSDNAIDYGEDRRRSLK